MRPTVWEALTFVNIQSVNIMLFSFVQNVFFFVYFQLITVICIGLHWKSPGGDLTTTFVTAGTFGGFLIILVGAFAGKIRLLLSNLAELFRFLFYSAIIFSRMT